MMRFLRLRGTLRSALFPFLLLSGCDSDLAGADHSSIIQGEPVPPGGPVVALTLNDQVLCSGVVIAERSVITAAHCVAGGGGFRVGMPPAGDSAGVEGVRVHPQYDAMANRHDLALLRLDRVLGTPSPVGALDASVVGKPFELVGYGVTSWPAGPNEKRRGTARVSSLQSERLSLAPDPSTACLGDSGGAVFRGEGQQELVAIIASGDRNCATRTDAERLDVAADFIASGWQDESTGGCSSVGRAAEPLVTTPLLLLVLLVLRATSRQARLRNVTS